MKTLTDKNHNYCHSAALRFVKGFFGYFHYNLHMTDPEPFLPQFLAWAEAQPSVRAAILTSTRAVPGAHVDDFSDYDIVLVVTDVMPFHDDHAWLDAFGRVLALYQDPLQHERGFPAAGYVIQWASGLKIDFTVWPVGLLELISAEENLPEEYDAGYRVLVDKDGLAARLRPPTYRAYIPTPPTAEEYREKVENFTVDVLYVARYLRRGDVIAAKHIQDMATHENLIPMLTWIIEIEHGWKLKPGNYGRRIQQFLRPELYAELERTFSGAGQEESWAALETCIALMHSAAQEVAAGLGFTYPEEIQAGLKTLLTGIKGPGVQQA